MGGALLGRPLREGPMHAVGWAPHGRWLHHGLLDGRHGPIWPIGRHGPPHQGHCHGVRRQAHPWSWVHAEPSHGVCHGRRPHGPHSTPHACHWGVHGVHGGHGVCTSGRHARGLLRHLVRMRALHAVLLRVARWPSTSNTWPRPPTVLSVWLLVRRRRCRLGLMGCERSLLIGAALLPCNLRGLSSSLLAPCFLLCFVAGLGRRSSTQGRPVLRVSVGVQGLLLPLLLQLCMPCCECCGPRPCCPTGWAPGVPHVVLLHLSACCNWSSAAAEQQEFRGKGMWQGARPGMCAACRAQQEMGPRRGPPVPSTLPRKALPHSTVWLTGQQSSRDAAAGAAEATQHGALG